MKIETDEQWRNATQQRFQDPDVTLKSYRGHNLEFIAQIELCLSLGDRKVKSIVLVKNDAPSNLLIETEVQSNLGFSVIITAPGGQVIDLLNGREVTWIR